MLCLKGLCGVRRSSKNHERSTEVLVDRSKIASVYMPHSEFDDAVYHGEMEFLWVILVEGNTMGAKNFHIA